MAAPALVEAMADLTHSPLELDPQSLVPLKCFIS